MRLRELKTIVSSTADAAFAVDGAGLVVAWNAAAEEMLGIPAAVALGQPCTNMLCGMDECGAVCSSACSIRQAAQAHHPVKNFDVQFKTRQGVKWCNVSVLQFELAQQVSRCSLHIVREMDLHKRMELLMRDFIITQVELPPEDVTALLASTRASASAIELTSRELEILHSLAKGKSTAAIASQFHISRATVNNHIQHILHKLNAHSRLEAIRRAEYAGLI